MKTSFANAKLQGEWAEICFLHKAASFGMRLSKPYGDSDKYDFVVDSGRRMLRVQVKSVLIPQKNFYQIKTGSGRRSKQPYRSSEVDFVAAYIIREKVWYVIPV